MTDAPEPEASTATTTTPIVDRYGFLGGDQYTQESEEPDLPADVLRGREEKWLKMLSKWDHVMKKDFKTVRRRCRKGIPRSIRGRAWFFLCGASYLKNKNPKAFEELLLQEGKEQNIDDIRKDLHRQFPHHEMFGDNGRGQEDLFQVLKAYSILNSEVGYCQAMAPIAATLLMHMPAEDAFWCLTTICDKYLKNYYSQGMEALQLDGQILFGLLKRVSPAGYKHLKKQKIEPVLYMTEWFLCCFTRSLPWSSVLRVWDMFLCEGVKVLFRVGLVLLKYTLGSSEVLKKSTTLYDTLTAIKTPPKFVTEEEFLTDQMNKLEVTEVHMRKEHFAQLLKEKKARSKLQALAQPQQQQ